MSLGFTKFNLKGLIGIINNLENNCMIYEQIYDYALKHD
jgi:hypothetical protein